MNKDLTRMEDDPDPVVAALAAAHSAAVRSGERSIAKRLETEVDKLTDPSYDLYAAAREAVRIIDAFRYDHGTALAAMKTYGPSGKALGKHGDEVLANLASRLQQAGVNYADLKGWQA